MGKPSRIHKPYKQQWFMRISNPHAIRMVAVISRFETGHRLYFGKLVYSRTRDHASDRLIVAWTSQGTQMFGEGSRDPASYGAIRLGTADGVPG